jgi:hypothetical protein
MLRAFAAFWWLLMISCVGIALGGVGTVWEGYLPDLHGASPVSAATAAGLQAQATLPDARGLGEHWLVPLGGMTVIC